MRLSDTHSPAAVPGLNSSIEPPSRVQHLSLIHLSDPKEHCLTRVLAPIPSFFSPNPSLPACRLALPLSSPSDQPLLVLKSTFTARETLGILILATVVVIFLTNVGSLLMSATIIGPGIACIHGAFRDPEDTLFDDQELPGSGISSFINGTAPSTAVAAAPVIVSHV